MLILSKSNNQQVVGPPADYIYRKNLLRKKSTNKIWKQKMWQWKRNLSKLDKNDFFYMYLFFK